LTRVEQDAGTYCIRISYIKVWSTRWLLMGKVWEGIISFTGLREFSWRGVSSQEIFNVLINGPVVTEVLMIVLR
jgi:hypothetical protein